MQGLAERQGEALGFIERYRADAGYSPSYREIADYMGISEKAVRLHLDALERKGYIRRRAKVSRTIVVV